MQFYPERGHTRAVDAELDHALGLGQHVARGAVERDVPMFHHDEVLGVLAQEHDLLLDDDDGDALTIELGEQLENLAARLRVELCSGLVEQHDLRAQCNDGRQRNLLLLPARKRRDAPVAQVADADDLESPGDA